MRLAKKQIYFKWLAKKLEYNSSPYTSLLYFLVRKEIQRIKIGNDLIKDGVEVITQNQKTSGGARWNYLAAYLMD